MSRQATLACGCEKGGRGQQGQCAALWRGWGGREGEKEKSERRREREGGEKGRRRAGRRSERRWSSCSSLQGRTWSQVGNVALRASKARWLVRSVVFWLRMVLTRTSSTFFLPAPFPPAKRQFRCLTSRFWFWAAATWQARRSSHPACPRSASCRVTLPDYVSLGCTLVQ